MENVFLIIRKLTVILENVFLVVLVKVICVMAYVLVMIHLAMELVIILINGN